MNQHVWWYAARATGYVAWGLLTASVVSGLLLSTRLTRDRPTPAWLLDLHRFLAALSVLFTAVHIGGLVADGYVHFATADVLLPFASSWKPGAVALGIISMYLLIAVEVSSLLMRRLPRRLWRSLHLLSYLSFWFSTFHLLTAGTDAGTSASRAASAVVMAVVVFLTLVRSLGGRSRGQRTQPGVSRSTKRASTSART